MLRCFYMIYKNLEKNGKPGRVSVSEEVGAHCAAEILSSFTKWLLSIYSDQGLAWHAGRGNDQDGHGPYTGDLSQ